LVGGGVREVCSGSRRLTSRSLLLGVSERRHGSSRCGEHLSASIVSEFVVLRAAPGPRLGVDVCWGSGLACQSVMWVCPSCE
jgi:hypothetical protein